MRYFSPNILDGSVTTAKLADNAVTLAKMADASVDTPELVAAAVVGTRVANFAVTSIKLGTATSSQSGDVPSLGTVIVSFDDHSFLPDIMFDNADVDRISLHAVSRVLGSAAADTPQWAIDNSVASITPYDIAWRHLA